MSSTQLPCADDTGPVVSTTPFVAFLERVQETALRTYGNNSGFDPKFYIDLSLKNHHDLSATESAFEKLTEPHNESVPVDQFEVFIKEYFVGPGEDMVYHEPEDFVPEPEEFLVKVENQDVRDWALEIHGLWKILSRRTSDSARDSRDVHTLLPLLEPVIIPGSRFREVYYWDSYWVIRGLLASKMFTTAKGIVKNLISFVDTYGYVLNGARAYYTNRSQPPLLSSMIYEIYIQTGDMDFIKTSFPALLKEYEFWNTGMHKVIIKDSEDRNHMLSRYYAMWNKPRPEASTTDQRTASRFTSTAEKQQFYRELATAAESGWDFSTRWMRDSSDFTTLATTSVIPVDLNVFLLKMELDISFLATTLGENTISERFLEASRARKTAINSILWNESMAQWLDYWISNNHTSCNVKEPEKWEAANQNHNAFASNFTPLWIITQADPDGPLAEKAMKTLKNSGLLCAAGIATSLTDSGHQWDYPNGWAPVQHMIVEGLVKFGSEEARTMAEDIAVRWIRSSYVAYKETGAMHEKLNVEKSGAFGGGGFYKPQTGFGWSNGVILAFLEEFGWPQDRKIGCKL